MSSAAFSFSHAENIKTIDALWQKPKIESFDREWARKKKIKK